MVKDDMKNQLQNRIEERIRQEQKEDENTHKHINNMAKEIQRLQKNKQKKEQYIAKKMPANVRLINMPIGVIQVLASCAQSAHWLLRFPVCLCSPACVIGVCVVPLLGFLC